ncbi:BRCT domain-containing protein At4g02110 isoform X1 [Primulina huaijiensis]|uniref:BRCT domain-containing protein At4g02110 isoform X1 n=2 Tax=Primulina huaijiensis TaxID=1492673 RepID=UPI003CC6FE3D
MPESRQILAFEEPAKPFAGARFVLFGFNFDGKEKILSRLFEGGGLDAVNYGPDCTHVIVDKLVYDDPVCVTARRDGKTLVTGLWVEHSLDVGVPVDPASIIYRPVKDFNGIPGALLLIVCLTGYQRQDRDDIMTMVSLMGANFSKPLVANKVTHLICYKFEGEKYELAKKIKKIKLVNHRWLEDCLKAWKILPEADYCKSGFELEMEAEAKDSEEETEDMTSIVDAGRISAASPQQTLLQNKIFHQSPAKPEILGNDLYLTEPRYRANASNASMVQSTPGKEIYLDSVLVLNETRRRQLDLLSSCTAKSPGKMPFEMPSNRSDEEMVSHKVENVLASAFDGAKKSPDADVSKSSGKIHCKITSGKSSIPLRSESTETIGGNTSVSNVDKLCVGGGFNIALERHQDGTDFSWLKTPIKGTVSHLVNEQTITSSEKTKTSDVLSPSKSPRVSCISKRLMERETVENVTEVLASGTAVKGSMGKGLVGPVSPTTDARYLKEKASSSPKKALNISKTPISEDKLECGKVAIQHYRKKGKRRSLSTNTEIKELSLSRTKSFHCEDEMHQSDVLSVEPSSPRANYEAEKSNSWGDLDFLNEQTDPRVKPPKTNMPVKKTLGSRPSFRKGATLKHKGSMNLKKVSLQNEDIIHSVEATAAPVDTNMATKSEKVGMIPPTNKDPSQPAPVNNFNKSGEEATDEDGPLNEEIKDPEGKRELEIDSTSNKEKASEVESPNSGNIFPSKRPGSCKAEKQAHSKIILSKAKVAKSGEVADFAGAEKGTHGKNIASAQFIAAGDVLEEKSSGGKKRALGKTKKTKLEDTRKEAIKNGSNTKQVEKKTVVDNAPAVPLAGKTKTRPTKKLKRSADAEKENEPVTDRDQSPNKNDTRVAEIAMPETLKNPLKSSLKVDRTNCNLVKGRQNLEVKTEPAWFILSGHKLQRKEFQQVIRRLKGRVCRDSHHWSYQATHFIVPDPIRRTEKFFAAAASGSWVLKTDYLTASNEAGRLLSEESFEWHKKGLSEDGAINLEAPRKWRLLREKTGHGAFYGMRVVIYGECIAPPLDTLKRVLKAGDGTILATSPPYSRFLQSGIDFAVVSPGMPRVDMWVQEFLRHEVPCVLADYLVEYVCKPGFSLERHVQYNTHTWAKKSLENLVKHVEEVVEDPRTPEDHGIDVACQVCGSGDRGEEMLICGDESGTFGCGVGAHMDCLDPPLVEVPEEDWFCLSCCKKRESTESITQDPKKRSSKRKK